MPRIGETRCINPKCSCPDVAVNQTASGNYSATCHKCGAPWFAKQGSKWRRDLDAGLLRRDQDETAAPPAAPGTSSSSSSSPPPSPAPAAAPAPAARKPVGLIL